MRSGRVTSLNILYNQPQTCMTTLRIADRGIADCRRSVAGRRGDRRRAAARAGTDARRQPARRHDAARRFSAPTASSPPAGTTRCRPASASCSRAATRSTPAWRSVLAASVCRDLALRLRRRSADDDLRREDQGDHRHQRPGPGAEGGDAGAVRREGPGPRQRPARRDDSGDARRDGARARSQGHDAPRSGDAAGDRARRRLPDVRVPAQLLRQRAQGDRAVGVVEEDLLSRRPRARRSARSSASRTWRARCARSPRPTRRRSRRRTTASRRSTPAATRSTPATSPIASPTPTRPPAACSAYDDLASYPRQDREAGDDELPRLRRLQGRPVEPGAGAAADAEHPRRRRPEDRSASTPPSTSTRCTRRSSWPTPTATRYYGDPAFAHGADGRAAVEGLRRRAARADRRAGVARAASRRSVQVRSAGEGAGRRLHAALAGREERRDRRRHDLRRRRRQGRQSVQRDAELRLAAGGRVHRRRHRRAALEPDDGVRSRSAEPERAGRRQAAAHDADADASC